MGHVKYCKIHKCSPYLYGVNWKLILLLTPVGIAMGLLTLYWVPGRYEAVVGIPFFVLCAWFIGRYAHGRHFLHGFVQGMLNSGIATALHVVYSGVYFARHPQDAVLYARMSAESGATPQQAMMLMGAVVALMSGLVMGLFALIGRKTVKTLGGER